MALKKLHIMIKPLDWRTTPLEVAAIGNPIMTEAVNSGTIHKPGVGAKVIQDLADIHEENELNVALFESSKAAQRVSSRILGVANPDDVFTVDYCKGNLTKNGPENIVNNMTAASRWLEPYVMRYILDQIEVTHTTQPDGALLEGGDYDWIPNAFGQGEGLLVTGKGQNSRSNQAGIEWLKEILDPEHMLELESEMFHRDLVSVLIQDLNGKLIQALLAEGCIGNIQSAKKFFTDHHIETTNVDAEVVAGCALNLLVNPGQIVGMQSNPILSAILAHSLANGVSYTTLPLELQYMTASFVDLQGGANCVSGHILVDDDLCLDQGDINKINHQLHSKDFEEYLEAVAKKLDMKQAVLNSKIYKK